MTRREELERLREAVLPFSACVFNDNGDVTISTGHLTRGDWLAIDAVAKALPALIAQEGQPPRFDEYGAYGENNPPVGAPSTREPTTTTLRWVWNAAPLKGHIGGPFVAEKVLQQCVRGADGNMVWQDVGEHNPPVQGGTGE